jgi:GAF domain-containing protein
VSRAGPGGLVPYHLSLAHAMERAAREIGARRDLATNLNTIVDVARRSMPGVDHVGVTRAHREGHLMNIAATDQLVRDLDDFQCALNEGPCVHAIWTDPVIVVERARHDQRWPRYSPAAVRVGVRSQLGLRLFVDPGETLGSLNMYSTTSDTIPAETRVLADLVAAEVAVVIKHVLLEEALSAALLSRSVVGTGVGIVMERYGLDNEQAFAYLARVSQHSNVKLQDVAHEIVAGVVDKFRRNDLDPVRPAAPRRGRPNPRRGV